VRVLALALQGIIDAADGRCLLGLGEPEFAALFSDAGLMAQAQALARTMRLAGDDVSMRAQRLMPTVIDRLGALLADPDASPRTITEIGRTLAQLSGSAARADASGRLAGTLASELEVGPKLPLISIDGGPAQLLSIHWPDPASVKVKQAPCLPEASILNGESRRIDERAP
jgi:hypothetical protein